MYMYMHVRSRDSLGSGGLSVTNLTVVETGVVGADTALLVALSTVGFSFSASVDPGTSDSIRRRM